MANTILFIMFVILIFVIFYINSETLSRYLVLKPTTTSYHIIKEISKSSLNPNFLGYRLSYNTDEPSKTYEKFYQHDNSSALNTGGSLYFNPSLNNFISGAQLGRVR